VVESLGNGRYRIDGRLAYAVRDRTTTWVFIDGRTSVIEPEAGTATKGAHAIDDQVALSAPMPATVLAIKTAVGQQVSAGDLLIVLEAMKMEVPITAPRDGRVKSIACRERELVQPGVPLLELE